MRAPVRSAARLPGIREKRSLRCGRLKSLAALLVLVVADGACLVRGLRAAGAPMRVVVLTPHVDAIRHEFGAGFASWHRATFGEPAEVEWRNVGGTSDSLRFIQSEFERKPDGIGLDCLFGGGHEPYLLLADRGWAQVYRPPDEVLAGIPRTVGGVEVFDAGHRWFGAALSSFGILQNLRLQQIHGLPRARRWEELADRRLRGWVGAGDPRNSGTMNVMFETFLQYYGWQQGWHLLTRIAGNVRKFDRVSSSTAKDVTLGETAYAFAVDFYGYTQVAVGGRTNLSFVLPEDFTAVNPDGIAVLKGAPNLVVARRFIDFVLSESGQKLWFLPRGHPEGPQRHSIEHMVVRPDFYSRYREISNVEFSPFDLNQNFRYDARLARARRDVLPVLFGALLVDPHPELQRAWRAVIERGMAGRELEELGRVPLSETEVNDLATGPWKDPAFRNRKKIEWQTWAQAKYRRLAAGH